MRFVIIKDVKDIYHWYIPEKLKFSVISILENDLSKLNITVSENFLRKCKFDVGDVIIGVNNNNNFHVRNFSFIKPDIVNSIAIIIKNNEDISDYFMITPTIRALKERYKNANITMAIQPQFKDIYLNNSYIKDIINVDTINKNNYDITFDLTNVSERNIKEFRITQYADFCKVDLVDYKMDLFLTTDEIQKGKKILGDFINGIGIVIKAVDEYRSMSVEKIKKLINYLISKGLKLILLDNKYFEYENNTNVLNLTGALNLRELFAVIKNCAAIVSPDTGFLYAAIALDIPTISYWGWSGFKSRLVSSDKNIAIQSIKSCSPCWNYMYKCQLECFYFITNEVIYNGIQKILNMKKVVLRKGIIHNRIGLINTNKIPKEKLENLLVFLKKSVFKFEIIEGVENCYMVLDFNDNNQYREEGNVYYNFYYNIINNIRYIYINKMNIYDGIDFVCRNCFNYLDDTDFEEIVDYNFDMKRDLRNKNVLIKRSCGVGDLIMITSLIKSLKEKYNCKISLLVFNKYKEFLKGLRFIDNIYTHSEFEEKSYKDFDEIIDYCFYPEIHCDRWSKDRIQIFLESFGFNTYKAIELPFDFYKKELMQSYLKKINVNLDKKIVSIQATSESRVRSYPIEYIIELAKMLVDIDYQVILLGINMGWKNYENIPYIKNVYNLIGKTTLEQAVYILHNSDYIICPDSSFYHIGEAIGKRTLVLFSNIYPELRVRYYRNVIPMFDGTLECVKTCCDRRKAVEVNNCLKPGTIGANCIRQLTPDKVFKFFVEKVAT